MSMLTRDAFETWLQGYRVAATAATAALFSPAGAGTTGRRSILHNEGAVKSPRYGRAPFRSSATST